MMFSQVPDSLLMVRPAAFGFNPETAASNAFQQRLPGGVSLQERALSEFDAMVKTLRHHGIAIKIFEDTPQPVTTDAIFPNNWITTHEDGKIVLYPMMAPSRRAERRSDVVDFLRHHYVVTELVDLTAYEHNHQFLEGTGSIVFDHPNRLAFACRSPRTDERLCRLLCERLGYTAVCFDALDDQGMPVYHTNVMMWIGEATAAVCLDALAHPEDREKVLEALSLGGQRIVALSHGQMRSFSGNMIEVKNFSGERFLLMSQAAYHALLPGQLLEFKKKLIPLALEIPTIEACGGGSVRCMVAGIHLKHRPVSAQ